MTELIKPYNEYLILLSVILGMINTPLLAIILIKKLRIEKQTKAVADRLVAGLNKEDEMSKGPNIFNVRGFIEGGVVIALVGVAIVGLIASRETVSKSAVVDQEKIYIDDSAYQCREVQRRVISYYDLHTKSYRNLPIPPQKDCQK